MTLYPASLPVDDIRLLIADIRGNSLGTDRARFVKAVWELTGFALKGTIGEPTGAPLVLATLADPVHTLTAPQVANHLELLLGSVGKRAALDTLLAAIPWQAIAKWGLQTILARL